jgi:hypothetical protein
VGVAYWKGLVDWLTNTLAAERKIDPKDLKLFHVTDDPGEVLRIIQEAKNDGRTNGGTRGSL